MEARILQGIEALEGLARSFDGFDPMLMDIMLAERDWFSPRSNNNNNNSKKPVIADDEMRGNRAAMVDLLKTLLVDKNEPGLDAAVVAFLNADDFEAYLIAERAKPIEVVVEYNIAGTVGTLEELERTGDDIEVKTQQERCCEISVRDVNRSQQPPVTLYNQYNFVTRGKDEDADTGKVLQIPTMMLKSKVATLLTLSSVFGTKGMLAAYYQSLPDIVQLGNDLCYFMCLQFDRTLQKILDEEYVHMFFGNFAAAVAKFEALRKKEEERAAEELLGKKKKSKKRKREARDDSATTRLVTTAVTDLWMDVRREGDEPMFARFFDPMAACQEEEMRRMDKKERKKNRERQKRRRKEAAEEPPLKKHKAKDADSLVMDSDDEADDEENAKWEDEQNLDGFEEMIEELTNQQPRTRDFDHESKKAQRKKEQEEEEHSSEYSIFMHYCYGLFGLLRPIYPVQFSRGGVYHPFPLEAMIVAIPYILTEPRLLVHRIAEIYDSVTKYNPDIKPSSMSGLALYLQFFTETHLRMCLTDILTRLAKIRARERKRHPYEDRKI